MCQTHNRCTKDPTPSSSNPDCKELREAIRQQDNIDLEIPTAKVKLVIREPISTININDIKKKRKKEKRLKNTDCYTNMDKAHGWCATYDMDNLTMATSLNDKGKHNVSKKKYRNFI